MIFSSKQFQLFSGADYAFGFMISLLAGFVRFSRGGGRKRLHFFPGFV